MPRTEVQISLLDLEPVQRFMLAANDLLCAAKESEDPTLAFAVSCFEDECERIGMETR